MRIGIITQPLANNYGGLLQNYALQTILKRLGHYSITIDQYIYHSSILWIIKDLITTALKNFLFFLLHKPLINSEFMFRRRVEKIGPGTRLFIKKHIEKTNKCYGFTRTKNLIEKLKLDAFITGSDQVWRKDMSSRIEHNFLDFAPSSKIKISYAASLGLDYWGFDEENTEYIKKLLRRFNAVSVREESAIELLRKNTGIAAVRVLDPTLLLKQDDYIQLMNEEKETMSNGELFAYILDATDFKSNVINKIAECKQLKYYSIIPYGLNKNRHSTTVTKWLKSFYDAKFVVCDSFHGVVFSIIFNKDFIAISNPNRGNTRFMCLLSLFNLENRLIDESISNEQLLSLLGKKINWDAVNISLNQQRVSSIAYLKENLK